MKQTVYSFPIDKITESADCWLIYPLSEDDAATTPSGPIKILKQYYSGQLPRITSFLKKLLFADKLDVTLIGNTVISATMNGTHLFTLKEEQYPDELKQELAQERAYNEKISSYLEEYLKGFPQKLPLDFHTILEDLPPMLMPYIYLHKQYDRTTTKRLNLSCILVKICAEIYHQAFPENPRDYRFCSLLDVWYKCRYQSLISSDLEQFFFLEKAYQKFNKALPKELNKGSGKIYFEIKRLLEEKLPIKPHPELKKYFMTCCAEILYAYVQDYSTVTHALFFKQLVKPKELKLPNYTNLILPKELPESAISSYLSL